MMNIINGGAHADNNVDIQESIDNAPSVLLLSLKDFVCAQKYIMP